MPNHLCPAQKQAYDGLLAAWPVGHLLKLSGETGMGKTTVLRSLHAAVGGAFLSARELLDAARTRHPLALEEAFEEMVRHALTANDTVLVDDLALLEAVVAGHCFGYPRTGYLNVPLTALLAHAEASHKRLVLAGGAATILHQRGYSVGIPEFKPADYEFLCRGFLGAATADRLDFAKVHRFTPSLSAHQLRAACLMLRQEGDLTTERFTDYLRTQYLASNVHLGEVQPVDLRDLQGVEDVLQSLEANLILPLENDELAAELNLKPKRGVLLAGPPGTGKTTIGRALAHRLKSKFFLLDGTIISGTHHFYQRIQQLFEAAKQNAPSIIFIDDSDVIFESGEELGLYRYLLTMLDGLESASAGRVCVMMTAMDVANLPPALVRSGRIELWLEMRLPDEAARGAILRQHLGPLPAYLADVDLAALVAATDGFTGADLKRLVEDGKTLYAYDRARGLPTKAATAYFLEAVETVRANKQRYATAEANARQQRPGRPPYFQVAAAMMAGT
jgi:ATP-dependent 26S proteasome regulatory subunit